MNPDPFHLLTESDRKLVFDGALRKSYQRGTVLFKENEVQPNLYVVRRGFVRVERDYQGQSLAIARYGVGEVLGEIAFLEQRPAFGTAVAEEEVELDIIEGVRLQAMLASDSGFASRFYHSLALCLGARLRQILPGIQLEPAVLAGARRPRLPRTGQVIERQIPAALAQGVQKFCSGLRETANSIQQGSAPIGVLQQRVNRECDDLLALLNQVTTEESLNEAGMADLLAFRDMADVARGIAGYLFRETFPFFMQSATIAHGYEKPRGYAEDREWLERIERNGPEGDGLLGPWIDAWFLGRPMCRAYRGNLNRLTGLLKEAAASTLFQEPIRITSLRAGTATEVFDLLRDVRTNLYVTCIDSDPDTLLADATRAKELHCAARITFLQADLAAVVNGQATISLGPQHVIYGLGVCDYLSDDEIRVLLKWASEHLAPGGQLVLGNLGAASPDRAFTEHILDWPVVHRSEEDFARLYAGSPFAPALSVTTHEGGATLIAQCRKD